LNFADLEETHITAFTWRGDSKHFAAGYSDGQFVIWDVEAQERIRTFQLEVSDFFYNLDWSSDQTRIAAVTEDFIVQWWDAETGKVIFKTAPFTSYTVDSSPYGGRLVYSHLLLPGQDDPKTREVMAPPLEDAVVFGDGIVQIVVPEASYERLETIQANCFTGNRATLVPVIPQSTSDLEGYIAQIKTLPAGTIPPACAADLIAVAEAVIAQGE
jgi:WD40 repeat protein